MSIKTGGDGHGIIINELLLEPSWGSILLSNCVIMIMVGGKMSNTTCNFM